MTKSEEYITRFTFEERAVHWLAALSFLYAALTGLALWSPRLFWLSSIFGGGVTVRSWHPWYDLCGCPGLDVSKLGRTNATGRR
jgi:cytochrome b subunit of formate dehydrogenase